MDRRRDEDLQRSEAILHFEREQDMSSQKTPENYKPHWSERDEQARPREMFKMGNSYSNLSIAANRNREMTVVTSEKRRHNSETLSNYQRKLNGQRRRAVSAPFGRAYADSYDPINSAFAFKTGKLQPAQRVLAEITKYADKAGQTTVRKNLPFLTLQDDKMRLQELQAEIRRSRETGMNPMELEQEKEQLFQTISQKEHMQSQFVRKMNLAIKKARIITDEEHTEWPNNVILSGDITIPDEPSEDEEDFAGGPHDDLQDNTQAKKNK